MFEDWNEFDTYPESEYFDDLEDDCGEEDCPLCNPY